MRALVQDEGEAGKNCDATSGDGIGAERSWIAVEEGKKKPRLSF